MLYHRKEHNAGNKAMTTTDTPRTIEILISCPSHLQEVALANLSQDLERELAASQAKVERIRSTMRSFILVSPIEAQRMEKIEAEAERFRELLLRAINEIEKTPFHTPKLTAFTAQRLADRYREKMTNTSTKPIEPQQDDK